MTIQIFKGVQNQELVLKADYDKLAAEFELYKKAHPQPFGPEMMKALDAYEKEQDECPESGMLSAFFILRDSIVIKDSQLQAAIAELRAQGVEILASKLQQLIDEGLFDAKEIGVIAGAIYEGAQIAAQLRAGKDGE